jgi:glycerophosphoryl diester phosphodiesterase
VRSASGLDVRRRPGAMPLVVTHGGEAALGYRNVIEALDEAIACGADMFEFDVRRTADDRLVVHHDECIGERRLRDLTLRDADAAARAAGYRLPLLEAVLDRARGALRLDVEVKEAGYERAIVQALGDRGLQAEAFVMTSFEASAIAAIRTAASAVTTGLLVYEVTGEQALRMFAQSGAAFLAPDHAIADTAMLQAAAEAGTPLVPWTVNDAEALERLMRAPAVSGVITDRPRLAMETRRRLQSTGRV